MLHNVDVFLPFKEVRLVQLNEADVLQVQLETLAAHIEAVFLGQTLLVWADPAKARALAEFSQMAPVELLVTHCFLGCNEVKGVISYQLVGHIWTKFKYSITCPVLIFNQILQARFCARYQYSTSCSPLSNRKTFHHFQEHTHQESWFGRAKESLIFLLSPTSDIAWYSW